ncbi:hypothetical protein [Bordetella avium]|nr:hypothetical protein [Bordetella avium]RIQ13816.1 DUF2946 domain-containing protein [Bordetella avium]RIQ17112.1 DUF2946 domain-containing protein [Bordetella avium]RIQ36162.1 DUF2946 domain-containing protein [Bordetella avium]RIQ39512.1 DUF2946 domain-containing protein [Bordetella avium]RIQ44311.1 DUF2946 domain-containing protein [Bordetella avium]
MRSTTANHRGNRSWQILICLAMAAFLLRALIPNGFMAAPSHALLTLCSGAGTVFVELETPGKPGNPAMDAKTCAFGTLPAQAILPPTGLMPSPSAAQAHKAPVLPAYRASLAGPPPGPPLGSRAPPATRA